nr:MAG TPA: hypothetical protein [Caudoviricetes sp.]
MRLSHLMVKKFQHHHRRCWLNSCAPYERHRTTMLVPTTLREVAVDNYPFILIVSAVYVVHALRGLVW